MGDSKETTAKPAITGRRYLADADFNDLAEAKGLTVEEMNLTGVYADSQKGEGKEQNILHAPREVQLAYKKVQVAVKAIPTWIHEGKTYAVRSNCYCKTKK